MNLGLIVSLVSAFVAALVSLSIVSLTRRSETIKQVQLVRTSAYVDFIRGIAGLGVLQQVRLQTKEDHLKGQELLMLVADAKARIAIYGSKPVVTELATFLRGGPVLDMPERAEKFTAVCKKMRGDGHPKPEELSDQDIHFLLFGFDMEIYLK